MKIDSGIISLDILYNFVKVKNDKGEYREIPHRTKDKEVYIPYRELVEKIVSSIPEDPGWYAWFKKGTSKPNYIGVSSKGKTSDLKARIFEELKEEYVAFWFTVDEDCAEVLTQKYNRKYSQKRAQKKSGSDAIIWVSYPEALSGKRGILDVVEQKLINEFDPDANEDKRDYSDIKIKEFLIVKKIMQEAFRVK
ncbi:hypothetical protein ACFL5P_01175 [candidate division KSB1 bacterium]